MSHVRFLVFGLFLTMCSTTMCFAENTVHWQWRDLICTTEEGQGPDKISKESAQCSTVLRETESDTNGRIANIDPCFDEVHNGTTRTYCDLLCPEADTVYLIKRNPQVHRSCFVFYTHRLEHRGNNWFLWRNNKCRHSEITFTIRCEFNFGRSKFPDDKQLFNSLSRRT